MNNYALRDLSVGLVMVIITAPLVIGLTLFKVEIGALILGIPLALGFGLIVVALVKGNQNELDYIYGIKESDDLWGNGY